MSLEKSFVSSARAMILREGTPDNWRRGLLPDRPNSRKTSGRKFAILGKIVRMGPCLRPFLAFSSGVRIRPNFAFETSFLRYRRPLTGRRCDYTSFRALKSFYRVVEASRVRLQCVLLPFLTRRPKPTCTNGGPCTRRWHDATYNLCGAASHRSPCTMLARPCDPHDAATIS